jgi:hypothetical protein
VNTDSQLYVSILDKTIQRKKNINEGSMKMQRRRGELDADDLLAVALEDNHPFPSDDVLILAAACDIPALALDTKASMLSSGSP